MNHRSKRAPTPVMAQVPPDFRARIVAGGYAENIYSKVSKDGRPRGIYSDATCTKKVDDTYLASVVDNVRFKPALEKGQPVDGVAGLKLNKLLSSF